MRFLCLVYFKPETLAALSPSEKATLTRDSMAYNDELRQRAQNRGPERGVRGPLRFICIILTLRQRMLMMIELQAAFLILKKCMPPPAYR